MTELYLPKTDQHLTDFSEIHKFLNSKGVAFSRWEASHPLSENDSQETVLSAYAHELEPYMKKHGYQTADVINVHPQTPALEALREKFIKEHTHSEDEIRFFVDGSGIFWFHFDDGVVAKLRCVKGDFLAVPKGIKHWFDLAPTYFVKAIRIFSNQEGWVAKYTGSGVDAQFGNQL